MRQNPTFVVDTNVLVLDYNVLFAYPNTNIILSSIVIEELDNLKKRSDETGRNSREVIRILDKLIRDSKTDISEGLDIGNGTKIIIIIEEDIREEKNDNKIIKTALRIKEEQNINPIIISQDACLRIKAKVNGIEAIYHDAVDKKIKNKDDFYSGIREINNSDLSESDLTYLFTKKPKYELFNYEFLPNEFVRIIDSETKQEKKKIIWEGIYKHDGFIYPLKNYKNISGISPANTEQKYAFNLLMDPKIDLVTLRGKAGSGKTIAALATALQLQEEGVYDRILITKPNVPVGKEIGFFPGTKSEKLEPWLGSIHDNLRALKTDAEIDMLINRGFVEFEAVSLFRGRSIQNSILIIDEAQNLSKMEAKTIVTRAGNNTKVILTYDSEQIDNVYLDIMTNGATHVTEKMKEQKISGHVTLVAGERSELSAIAAELL